MANDLVSYGLQDAARAIRQRRISPVELTQAILDEVDRLNPMLNAFLSVTREAALGAARSAERVLGRKGSSPGPLLGVPISVKDLIVTKDGPTTLGSRIVPDGISASDDAVSVARARRAGAVIIGKTNLHEVALGVTGVNEHFGPARNPYDPTRISGGSSSGSAVAVAAGLGAGSIGTDTRGSIRIPSACCGVVGFKPTYGAVSIEGVFPLAATLDHVGPIARTVGDAALLFAVLKGARDPGGWAKQALAKPRRRLRVALSNYFFRDAEDDALFAAERAIEALKGAKAEFVDVEIGELESALEASRVIVLSEAVSYHDPFLKRGDGGYGPAVRSRLEGGYRIAAIDLVRAEESRLRLQAAYTELFRSVDAMLLPVIPILPPPIGTDKVAIGGVEVSIAEAFCRYNAPQNLTGVPALSIPVGTAAKGLPMAVQVVTGWNRDADCLKIGHLIESALSPMSRPSL